MSSPPTRPSFAGPAPVVAAEPPSRWLLRLAGVLSQLSCGICLLIGTIAVVLVQQSKTGQIGAVVAWLAGALVGLIFGGLVYRGGAIRMVLAALADATFGVLLVTLDDATLRTLLKILPASDVDTISDGLYIAGFVMLGAAALCLAALPQSLAFARWFRTAAETHAAMSTARGFPPPPVPARGSVYIIPGEELPSRRRLYMVLGGLAIGVGAGFGVLVSANRPARTTTVTTLATSSKADPPAKSGTSAPVATPPTPRPPTPPTATPPTPPIPTPPPTTNVVVPGQGSAETHAPTPPPQTRPHAFASPTELLAAEHKAITTVDPKALSALLAPTVFGFGVDATELVDGRDGVVAQIVHDLGDPPDGGFTVVSHAPVVGEDRGHAWIAEDLEIGGANREPRHFAISALAARLDGSWAFVAVHWAMPVSDATAERMAILKTLPTPQPIPDRHDPDAALDHALRAAFASREAFAEAASERPDAFNYGSGGERARGASIKKVFSKLRATIRLHDGARVVAGGAWDPSQQSSPWIAWAAVNVDFTSKTRAATDVTQTFRVLAILLKDNGSWKVLQTHWSNGGPIH